MKKIVMKISSLSAFIILLTSCGMKNCKCYSKHIITENDSLIQISIDTVENNTKHGCEDFNKEETLTLDSIRTINHTLFCEEE